jgi:hypothetical protein
MIEYMLKYLFKPSSVIQMDSIDSWDIMLFTYSSAIFVYIAFKKLFY